MSTFIRKKEGVLIIVVAIFVSAIFFYKTVLHQQIPFPGDLLVNQTPYQTETYLGYAPGGYPNMAQGRDVLAELYPWKNFTIQSLKSRVIPFWNPYNFSGNVHMQNYQSAVFSPFNIFFFLLPFSTAWSFSIIFQPILAILFMYIFLRSLKLSISAAVFGGIAFGFSSYMTVWMEYGNIDATLLWLPLVLFGIHKFIQNKNIIYIFISIVSLAASFFSGYIQGTFYIYVVSLFFTIYHCFPLRKTVGKWIYISLFLVFFLPICIAAFQLIPTYAVFLISSRSKYSLSQIEDLLQPLYYWVTVFVPDFFGNPAHRNYILKNTYIERVMYCGIPVIFFSFLAVAKVKNREMNFFIWLAIVFLIITTNFPLIKYIYILPLPMITTTVPTRALSIFITSMVIIGSFGVDFWYRQKKFEKTIIPCIFAGIYLGIWLLVVCFPSIFPEVSANKSITIHNLFFPTVIAALTIMLFYGKYYKKLRVLSVILLFTIVVVDLFFYFQKITPFSPKELLYPQTPVISYLQKNGGINRFWGYGSAYIPPNMQTFDHVYSPEGYDPLYLQNYGVLLSTSADGKYHTVLPRPDANIAPGYGADSIKNPFRQRILDLLGTKYVLAQWSNFPENHFHLIWHNASWQIYENRTALPRFFLASQSITDKDTRDTLAKIYSVNIAKTVILADNPVQPISSKASGSVSLVKYTPNTVVFQTNTTGNMLLFLSDNYSPEWSGKIDDTIVPIYKADLSFRAIEVPKGRHVVTMYYNPVGFFTGLKIALIGVIICILYSIYYYRYVEKK